MRIKNSRRRRFLNVLGQVMSFVFNNATDESDVALTDESNNPLETKDAE